MKQLLCMLILLAGAQVARAGDAPVKPTKKGTATTRTTLPETHEDQRVLRKYLATLTEKDFTHGVKELMSVKTGETDPEYQYRNHIYTMLPQPLVGSKRGIPAVNAPPRLFLLSSLETPQGVMQPPVWPETLMAFVQWNNPGNPYFNNRGLKMRAFATATVMMTMIDDTLEQNPGLRRGDWFSYQLVYCGLPYPGFKDVLPSAVQKAYEAGLRRLGESVISWGIKGEEPYADLIGPFGLHCAAKALNDLAFTKAVEAYARKLYTDPRYFNPAGYWTFRGGPDVPFDGQTRFFAATTALATDWPFAKEAVERTYKLRAHLILTEPDGKLTGPSHFNSRLSGPASVDQWAWEGARDIAAAMVTDEAAHLVQFPSIKDVSDGPGKRARQFGEQIRENPVEKGRFLSNEELVSYPWKWRVWMTFHFPASVNPGYEYYRPGAYAHQVELRKKNSPLLKSPFERGDNFVRDFGQEFVVAKQPSFAAILHTGPIGGQDPSEKFHQYKGPMGLGGGQLSAFWTPAAGSVLLGQRGGMTYDKSLDLVPEWRTWPIHAVSGSTADGVFFTSARIQKPDAAVDVKGDKAAVKVAGTIPAAVVGQDKSIIGKYDYARSFDVAADSVTVTTTIRGDGKDKIAELYETLPVYLRDVREQVKVTPTLIEFQVGGKWAPATDKFAEGVQAVRLTRFKGAAVVKFDTPRRAKLSPADWTDAYLSRGSARNVLIDLLENKDQPTTLTAVKSVRYTIAAER